MTPRVREILSWYQGDEPAVLAKLNQVFSHGTMGGTGKLVLADVSGGIENGPAASFHGNPDSYNPEYFYKSGIELGISALVAPQGMIELCARDYAGELPVFLKIHHNVVLHSWSGNYQTSAVEDAQRLGCVGIAIGLAVGNDQFQAQVELASGWISQARSAGLAALVSIERAAQEDDEKKREELPVDQVAQATHLVCELGAHIIQVPAMDQPVVGLRDWYGEMQVRVKDQHSRMEQVMSAAYQGQRPVVGRLSRHWPAEKIEENLAQWTSAGVFGYDLSSHLYTFSAQDVSAQIQKNKEILLGVSS